MRVFITGVSGFVGTGLVEYFQSHDVVMYGHGRNADDLRSKFRNSRIEIIDEISADTFSRLKIDCVVHLAGIAHDLSNKFVASDYYEVNEKKTITIFNHFNQSTASTFIFLSSIKACVDSSTEPVNETAIPHPISDYGKSKLAAEDYILHHTNGKKNVYIFRPCMIHGKGNKGNLNLLYKYVKSGLPYVFGAYSNRRSFLSADNLNYIISRFSTERFPSGIYHLADAGSLSTSELVSVIASSLQRKPRIWNLPVPMLDAFAKAGAVLGLPSEKMKQKLTESLVVSTEKLSEALKSPLPVDNKTGLLKTLTSFNE